MKVPIKKMKSKAVNGAKNASKSLAKRSGKWQILAAVILILVLTVCIVATSLIAYVIAFTNGDPAIDLQAYKNNQNQTTIIYAYDKDNNPYEYCRLNNSENRIWVDLDKMSPVMYDTLIAMEDKRFESHEGVDWVRTVSSTIQTFIGKDLQGGSTITQQLIKNLTGEKDITLVRKFNEITYALNLEKHASKQEIAEAYLNTIYLGENCYGVQTAAEKYFGKDVKDLNLAECASLLAITNAPTAYNPLLYPEANKARQEYCLGELRAAKKITKEEYEAAKNYKLVFTNSPDYKPSEEMKQNQKKAEVQKYDFYTEYVIDSVIEDLQEQGGYSKQKAIEMVFYGGLRIYSAVDPNVQSVVTRVYENRETFAKEEDTPAHPAAQSAMVVMDYSGRVVGIGGQAGKKSGNRCLNRATDTVRSPGSSIKPLAIYAPGIEYGLINWSSQIPDAQIYYQGKKMPYNYGGGSGSGKNVTAQNALARSLNTVPVRILTDLTFERSYNFLQDKFHISTLNEDNDKNYSPLAMGGMYNGAKVIDMTAAYAAFGNGGKYYEPYCYYKVTDSKGKQVYLENKSEGERAISEETAQIMCEMLKTVITDPQGTTKAYPVSGYPTMAKSGTTTDDHDRWFIGGTPYYVSAVWYGYDAQKPIRGVYGNPSGNIFKKVMNEIHEGLPKKEFPVSENVAQLPYCVETGDLATEHCTATRTGWYNKKSLPSKCKLHNGEAPSEGTSETASQAQ